MSTNSEELGGESLIAFQSDLSELSGKYGEMCYRPDGTLISNDHGFKDVLPRLKERFESNNGGMAMVVGSGGLPSLMPDIPADIFMMVDSNPAVLELNRLIFGLIKTSESPNEVLTKLIDPDFRTNNEVLRSIDIIFGDIDMTAAFIKAEASQYGGDHWTNPSKFKNIKDILTKKPIVFMAADIRDKEFGEKLSSVANKYNEKITFINFTNVHSWLKPMTMEFINKWPTNFDTTIMYSSHKDGMVGDWPKMYLANGVKEYISETNDDNVNAINH